MKKLLAFVLLLALLMMPVASLGDAGGFSGDSDWGGGSDWDSGSDWGGSSDWDSSDWGSSGGGVYYYDSGSGGSGGSGGGIITVIILIVVAIVVLSMLKNARKSNGGGQNHQAYASTAPSPALASNMAALVNNDPDFSEEAFKADIANVYIQMQNCWQNKDWEPMRAHLTDTLYNQMGRQLDALKSAHRTNFVERISVLSIDIVNVVFTGGNDVIDVILKTRITDYTVDDNTGSVINGDKNAQLYMTYKWTLIRSTGTKTVKNAGVEQLHCQSCGAPIAVNHSAKCEYCGAILTSSRYGWTVSQIQGISQRTQG